MENSCVTTGEEREEIPEPPSVLLPLTVTQCSPSVHPEALPSVLIRWAQALWGTFKQLQGLGSLCPFQPWLPVTLVSMAAMQAHPSYSGAAGCLGAALPIVLESCKEAKSFWRTCLSKQPRKDFPSCSGGETQSW